MLDWLKYTQSETTGIKLGFSRREVAEMDAEIDAAWREAVEEEVNRRLAARGLAIETPPCREFDRQLTRPTPRATIRDSS